MNQTRTDRLQALGAARLYLVTDDRLPEDELFSRLRAALRAGVRVVQFRAKGWDSRRAFLRQAQQIQQACREHESLFIVNDAVDVAALLDADGVHLGQDDLPPDLARRLVGSDMLIGQSISYLDEAIRAQDDPDVDYLGVGAMYATTTKPEAEFGGFELLRAVRARVSKPLVAIGGITLERAPEVWAARADLVAVVSAVFKAPDSAAAAAGLLKALAD